MANEPGTESLNHMPCPSIDQKLLTAAELAQATAGGVNYIRTKKNKVRGLAFKPTFNPHSPKAPGESGTIVFGTGKRRTGSAYLFLKSGAAVPTYAKRGTNAWEYFGDYRATKILYGQSHH